MPTDFDPKAVLDASSFTLSENEHKNVQQASITYMMRAGETQVLGGKGETLAFGKPKYDTSQFQNQTSAKEQLDAQVLNMKKNNPAVKEWSDLKTKIEGLPGDIQRAEYELQRTQTTLQAKIASNSPAEVIAQWTANQANDQAGVDAARAEQANLPQLQGRFDQLSKHSDVETMHALEAQAHELNYQTAAVMAIAGASSPLYPDKDAMTNDPTLGGDRELLTRSVASFKVDQLLGTHVIAEEKLALGPDGQLLGVSVQGDGAQVTGKHGNNDCFLNANYKSPEIQKGMADLEVMDYVTGQIDRHNGNIFVDPSNGKVTGIDNDLAFPAVERENMLAKDGELTKKAVKGLPKQISEDTAQKIMALSPERLQKELSSLGNPDGSGKLGQAEISGAMKRLQDLQTAIKNPAAAGIEVVAKFDDRTFAKAIQNQMDEVNKQAAKMGVDPYEVSANLDFTNVDMPSVIADTPKASYLGSAVMQGRMYEINQEMGIEEDGIGFGKREPDTVGQARLNPEFAAYKKAEQNAIKSLAGSPQLIENLGVRQNVTKLQSEMEPLKAKLADYQKQLDKLEHPSLADKAKAKIAHGGVEGAKEYFKDKQAGVLQQLKAKEEGLATELDKAVEPIRAEMRQLSQQKQAVELPPQPDIEMDNEVDVQNGLQVEGEVSVNNNVPIEQQVQVEEQVDAEVAVLKGEQIDNELNAEVKNEIIQEEQESVEEEVAVEQHVADNKQEAKQEQKQEQKQEAPAVNNHQKEGSVGQSMSKARSPGIQKLVEMGIQPPVPPVKQEAKQDGLSPAEKTQSLRAQFQRQPANPGLIGEHRAQNVKK